MLELFYPPRITPPEPSFVHTTDERRQYEVKRQNKRKLTPEEKRQRKAQWMRDKRARERENADKT